MIGKYLDKLGGRKMFMVLLVFTISTVFTVFGKLLPAELLSIVQMLVIAYPSGSIVQKAFVSKTEAEISVAPVDENTDYSGGRKFGLSMFMYIVLTTLTFFGQLPTEIYVSLTQWIVGIYIAGNVTEKLALNGISLPGITRK